MRNRWYVTLLLCLLLLTGIASRCGARPTTPPPTEPPEKATDTPRPPLSEEELTQIRKECEAQSEKGRARQSENPGDLKYPPYQDLLYIEGQVVLSGPQEAIQKTVQTLGLALERTDGFELGDQTTIQLYIITDGRSVEQVTCEIDKLRKARPEFAVFADPNYHVSPAGGWTGGGSPWTQNGDWASPGGGLGEAPGADFVTQWAFEAAGIGLSDTNGDRRVTSTGKGIRIGVFDTSPFAGIGETGRREFPWQELMKDTPEELSGKELPSLTVWHIEPIPAPTCPGIDRKTGRNREGQDLSNHGLFVAGLAHAVAPSSEVYLVRVLEDDACGSLFTINKGIKMYMDEMADEQGELTDTIINLSLGVHEPPEPARFGLPATVKSLESVLELAVRKGAVVVAAAGNDSYDQPPDAPGAMEIPAAYSFVVGVAASDVGRERGCFSNIGDVAAPGGDGEAGRQASCEIPDCLANPELCLISLALNSRTGYAYWVGTSFAAPLVSGQAALLLEAAQLPLPNVIGGIRGTTCLSPDPTLPHGIIYLPRALLGTSCP